MLLALVLCLVPLSANGALPKRAFYEMNKGQNLIYGDIMLSERQKFIRQHLKNARMSLFVKDNGANRWPDSVIPYKLSTRFTGEERSAIQAAFKVLEQRTCFLFLEKTSQHTDYVKYEPNDGCHSPLGRQGGRQVVSLSANCVQNRTILHETMHTIGVLHEHQCSDRDKYIDIKWENIKPGYEVNFDSVATNNEYETNGFAYDPLSIMHYHGHSFGKHLDSDPADPHLVTMVLKGTNTPVPYNEDLSDDDVKKLRFVGNCPNVQEIIGLTKSNNSPTSTEITLSTGLPTRTESITTSFSTAKPLSTTNSFSTSPFTKRPIRKKPSTTRRSFVSRKPRWNRNKNRQARKRR